MTAADPWALVEALNEWALRTDWVDWVELGGSLVAWKGARDPEEETAGAAAAEILGLEPTPPVIVRPFRGSRKRNLYVYTKKRATPERFPRRAGMANKRPLAP